jgi:AcrR family transcriptional regulator
MSPRLTDESRRERIEGILAAAARVFVERGYDRATLREIAGAAGVSTGAVYAYFRTKEELLLEICRRQAEVQEMVLQEALSSFSVEDGDFETSFRTALAPFLRLSEEETRRREMVNLLFWYESVREPELRALLRGAMGSWRQAVAGRVREEQRAGRLRADLDPEAFATVLFALPFGMQLYELLVGEGIDREAFVRDAGTVLQSGTRPADREKGTGA